MRMPLITWPVSAVILIVGALLAALARDSNERPRNRCNASCSIDTRELTNKATEPLPLQFYDAI